MAAEARLVGLSTLDASSTWKQPQVEQPTAAPAAAHSIISSAPAKQPHAPDSSRQVWYSSCAASFTAADSGCASCCK